MSNDASETNSNSPTATGPEQEPLVVADDSVIGKAFRWSLLVIVVIGVVVGLIVYLNREKEGGTTVQQDPLVLPQGQRRDAKPPTVRFTEITEAAGIDFTHESGARGSKFLPETMGGGCAFFDYDSDGDVDLLLVNSTTWPGTPAAPNATLKLYANDGKGVFADATEEANLAVTLYGHGVAVGDYDNDGHPDVYVTSVHENRLFRNLGGKFEDVTQAAGVGGGDVWSTSAGFFDADNDGDLDLFVCNYLTWSPKIDEQLDYQLTGVGRAYGPPNNYAGTQSFFFRNNGDGTFAEEAKAAGFHVDNPTSGGAVGKALGLVPVDADRDGWIDLVVANDTVRNFFFHNRGNGTFQEAAEGAGLAYDRNGAATGAMGIDISYFRNDASLGLAIGNFANEMSSLYVSEGVPTPDWLLFSDEAITEGIGPVSRQLLSFGLFFFDYDLDGRQDLFQTNGHLEEEINAVQPSQHYKQPSQLFWNCGTEYDSCFVPVADDTTGDLRQPVVGRASAYADIDGDGDLDVVITQTGDRALLIRNDQALGNHWMRLRLVGTRCNRDAIGAIVEVKTSSGVQRQQVMPTRSYLSQVEPTLTFGLGLNKQIDSVRVFWPGETTPQDLGTLAVDQVHEVKQP